MIDIFVVVHLQETSVQSSSCDFSFIFQPAPYLMLHPEKRSACFHFSVMSNSTASDIKLSPGTGVAHQAPHGLYRSIGRSAWWILDTVCIASCTS